MLTIIGSGVNLYSLREIGSKINWEDFDCVLADLNFNNEQNIDLIPKKVESNFLNFKDVKQFLKDNLLKKMKILYVVTGNPAFFSATGEILKFLERELPGFDSNQVNIIGAESSKDYLLSKLKLPENEVISLSLHGRKPDSLDLSKFLLSKYTFILCDEHSLKIIAEETHYIKDDLTFYTGSKLGSENEDIQIIDLHKTALEFSPEEIEQKLVPYVILVERNYDLPSPSSKDADFMTNAGMLTKSDKRFLTLQALELKNNLLLWDIGAGSGSVAVDSYKIFKTRAVLFEKNEQQCDFIKKNLTSHKVAGAKLIEGNALDNCFTLPNPDRIFIGGGGKDVLSKITELYNLLNDSGILVANIIGLENLTLTVEILKNTDLNYNIRSISIDNYKKMSNNSELSISEPERTLFQIIIKK